MSTELGGQTHGRDTGVNVVGVHVHDGHVEALGHVAGIPGGAAVLGVGGEAHLVVDDHMDRAAG
jgi:hypothetical protein